jgi:hypothetical protein
MPSGTASQPIPIPRRTSPGEEPGLLLRLRVRFRAPWLDRSLAGGAHPTESPELRLRAEQLLDPRERERIARSIDDLLQLASQDRSAFLGYSRIPFDRGRVRANGESLRQLAGALRRDGPLAPRGVAMAGLLLSDFRGPIYTSGPAYRLSDAVAGALAELER